MAYPWLQELRLSHSTHSTYQRCHRKIEFSKFLGLRWKYDNLAGDVGKALHEGYQEWMISRDRQLAMGKMMLAYPIDLNSDPKNYRSLEACFATLNAMIDAEPLQQYEIAKIECLDGEVRPAVEVPFRIDIANYSLDGQMKHVHRPGGQAFQYDLVPSIPIYYVGYIDLILFDKQNQEYVVVDIKTHRNSLEDMSARYEFDEQCLPYGLVLEQMLGNINEGFRVRYLSVYIDIENPKVRMYGFPKSAHDVQDWAQGLMLTVQNISWEYQQNWFQRTGAGDGCLAFKRPCAYAKWCTSRDTNKIREMIMLTKENVTLLEHEDPFEPWVRFNLQLGVAA